MSAVRFCVLFLGPFFMVAAAYAVSMQRVPAPIGIPDVPDPQADESIVRQPPPSSLLHAACDAAAVRLHHEIGPNYAIIVRAPFVIAGDTPAAELQRCYERTILPVSHALSRSFFETPPDQPITLVLLASEDSYRELAGRLDGDSTSGYYGYYRRETRRIVANRSTGEGTIAHELTHALAQFDFPAMPEWFDEGLASLYEESEFSSDDARLVGLHNWRRRLLQSALERQKLPDLQSLQTTSFRAEGEGLRYAQARYLCLYLQEQGVLEAFYRCFRERIADDPTGSQTLCEVLQAESLAAVDRQFQAWLSLK